MSYWEALCMGILQGLTEFLPVSSSGHLVLGAELLGLGISAQEQLYFTLLLHLSTALSTVLVFRKKIGNILIGLQRGNRAAYRWIGLVLLSAVPAGIVGLLFRHQIESFFVGRSSIVGGCLLLTGLLLLWGHRQARPVANRRPLGIGVAIAMGLAQALALLPGVSRSGATLSTALGLKVSREEAAEFSFLMVLVPILGSSLLSLLSLREKVTESCEILCSPPVWLGACVSFVVGYWACLRMLDWVKRAKLIYFAIYCFLIGSLTIGISL